MAQSSSAAEVRDDIDAAVPGTVRTTPKPGKAKTPDSDSPVAMRGHRSNFVGVPTDHLASNAFNDDPTTLHITGCRLEHAELFQQLYQSATPEAAADLFQEYMAALFKLSPDHSGSSDGKDGKRRFRASYLRLLKGWMFDSNAAEGAVMKGWVESRFGLFPTYHKEPLRRFSSEAWAHYVEQKMSSRFHNNAIHTQLDLLYEFCQWMLARNWLKVPLTGDGRHLRLYRGVNDFDEHHIVERPDKRTAVLHLNNLCSFSCERDIAGQFGDNILEAEVPLVKVVFFRDILPRYPFAGEGEYLVVGGDYRVKVSIF